MLRVAGRRLASLSRTSTSASSSSALFISRSSPIHTGPAPADGDDSGTNRIVSPSPFLPPHSALIGSIRGNVGSQEPYPTSRMGAMNFVRSAIEEDEQFAHKRNADFVHILMTRKKTFVTLTDSKGNRKAGASGGSAGSLEERKGRSRSSRYAAEATAEYVGRLAKKMGVKSVVVKVKGSTTFKRKSKAILSWREGFQGERVGQSPIMYIQDVTQLPHGGCRLPKRRRT